MVELDTCVYAVVIEAMELRDAKRILREIINDVPPLMETCILKLNQTLENRHHSFFIYQILGGLVNGKNKGSNLTEYVMVSAKNYNEQVDVWTVARVFPELLLRRESCPGNNHFEQYILSLIFSIFGTSFKHEVD